MAKIVLDTVTGGYDLSIINNNFDKIEQEFQNKILYRDNPVGESNTLATDIDTNGKRIFNLPAPIGLSEVARLQDVQNAIAGATEANLISFKQLGTGAVTRTVQDKIREFVSVLDFGADPTGVADSTAAFSAASAASPVVIIPAGGTYRLGGTVTGSATFINFGATLNGALPQTVINLNGYGVTAPYLATALMNQSDQLGTKWQSQYHANWNVVQSLVPYNPTEWQVYPSAANGIAQVIAGTNQVVRVSGTPFDPAWVGLPYFYWEGSGYKVLSVTDADHMTVQTTGGGAVSWGSTANGTFYFVATTVNAVVNVNGTAVTWVSGQPFIPFCDFLYINGVQYSIATFNNNKSLTLTASAGTLTGATLKQYVSIANELTNLRLQGLSGANEENFVITMAPNGTTLQHSYAGAGKYRPIWIGSGENPIGTLNPQIGIHPSSTLGNPGWLTLGGDNGSQVLYLEQNASNVNYMRMAGGTAGGRASVAIRGTDSNPGLNFDTQGTGDFLFTSGSFGRTNFKVFGSAGTSYLAVDASASNAPTMVAIGGTNPSVKIAGGGTGGVLLNDGGGTSRVIVDTTVGFRIVPLASATPTANGELTFQATSNTSLTFKYKGSDGVVRSASLTLA